MKKLIIRLLTSAAMATLVLAGATSITAPDAHAAKKYGIEDGNYTLKSVSHGPFGPSTGNSRVSVKGNTITVRPPDLLAGQRYRITQVRNGGYFDVLWGRYTFSRGKAGRYHGTTYSAGIPVATNFLIPR